MRREESFFTPEYYNNIASLNKNLPRTNWLVEESMDNSPSAGMQILRIGASPISSVESTTSKNIPVAPSLHQLSKLGMSNSSSENPWFPPIPAFPKSPIKGPTSDALWQRTDMSTFFDVFCVVKCTDEDGVPMILTKYPEDFNDEAVLKSVRQFSFPCKMKELDSEAVQLFSFVLTDAQSRYTFGYCRYTPRNNTCICFLSGYSWPSVFNKILDHVSLVMTNGSQEVLESVLSQLYSHSPYSSGDEWSVSGGGILQCLDIVVPDVGLIPTLVDDKFLLDFFNSVPFKQMFGLYSSLVHKRRVVVIGRNLTAISASCHGAFALMEQTAQACSFRFMPILPEELVGEVLRPGPALIGVQRRVLERLGMLDLGDCSLMDLDTGEFESDFDDVDNMSEECQRRFNDVLAKMKEGIIVPTGEADEDRCSLMSDDDGEVSSEGSLDL